MNKRTITLGEKTYLITELPARQQAAWRRELEAKLNPVLNIIEQAGAGLELRSNDDIFRLANSVGRLLVSAPDLLIGLLFTYAPNLKAEEETILDTAYDSELIAAFSAVLALAYPFGSVVKLVSLANGLTMPPSAPTSTNSPSPNGALLAKS